MAGDWIKVEHATLTKPEVLRAAEMLGVHRDEAFGIMVRFWIWLDNNLSGSCPDFVRNMSRKGLDEFMHVAGFAAVLEAVGWAEFDEKTWTVRIINAARHNGNPAKTRALDAKRKVVKRLANVFEMSGCEPDVPGTREEKRREEVKQFKSVGVASQPPAPKKTAINGHVKRATRLQESWSLPDDWRDWAVTVHHMDPQKAVRVSLDFRDYWSAVPGQRGCKLDWPATWRRWIRKETGNA